ncbi:MFS transporter [Rugosimonospora acidiphila]|uniref:MFS transporter n=1 Tax=Rugosimonospora acidiphila TaxID=556531 RepID=A0ABP9SR25_9ACTN
MRKWVPLITVCLGTFMLLIDVTIVNVALPDMARDLSTSFSALQWVVDGYALSLAALLLGAGSIADMVGHRRTYVAGLALFALASLVCGVAPNAGALVGARLVQGVGAAAMFATTFALLNSSYQGRDRGTAYGLWGAVSGIATAIGPVLGGLLTEGISWRWIFFVNLPISVLAIVMCLLALRDVHAPTSGRLDLGGMVTFTASAAAITYGLIHASENGWSSAGSWGYLVAGAALLALFVLIESRSAHAMLDLGLMRNGSFVGILVCGMLMNFSAFAYFTYTSIWMQSVLGMSPITAGLTGLPLSVATFVVSAGFGRFLHGARPGPVIGSGLVLIGLGGLLDALLVHGDARWTALLPGFLVAGVGLGLVLPVLSSSAMSAVPPQRGGMAAGAMNTARQLGFAFGIALLGSVFAARAQHSLGAHGVPAPDGVARALAGGQAGDVLRALPAPARAATDQALHLAAVSGLRGAFVVAAVLGVLAGLLALALIRPRRPDPVILEDSTGRPKDHPAGHTGPSGSDARTAAEGGESIGPQRLRVE